MTSLTILSLDHNGLAGSIPAELGNLTSLTWLSLRDNGLTGSIPAALGNLTNLDSLILNNNGLTGIPPELGNLTNLGTLYLQFNDFTGSFPAMLLDLTSLEDLRLNNNGFTGSIPAALGNLTNLDWLSLDFNSFTGAVPAALGNLPRLLDLDLSRNLLAGELPQTFIRAAGLGTFRTFFIFHNDGLCAPANPEFQAWLERIQDFRGDTCGKRGDAAASTVHRQRSACIDTGGRDSTGHVRGAMGEHGRSSSEGRTPRRGVPFGVLVLAVVCPGDLPLSRGTGVPPPTDLATNTANEFRHMPVPAADIPCILEVTEVRGGRGTTTLTISSTARVPDLSVREPLTVSDGNPGAGQGLTLTATIDNLGTASAPPTTVRYYLTCCDPSVGPDDPVMATDAVEGLDAAASGDSVVSVAAPFTAGSYYYVACADSVHGEVYADNNCATSGTVRVTGSVPPDLVVVAPAASHSQVYPGQHFTVSATVRNQAVAPTGGETRLMFMQSTDAQLSPGDTLLDVIRVENLAGGGETRKETGVWAPSTPGRYYYGACVAQAYGEVDTTNNCSAGVEVVVGDEDENQSPVAVGTLPPLSLQVDDDPRAVPVAGAFDDPDGDALTYGATSSSPPVAVWVSGSTVMVVPLSDGTATVTVRATDPGGLSATQAFTVTVSPPPANRPPLLVGALAPLTIGVDEAPVTVEVSGAFWDPDGDELTYGATSLSPGVASVALAGSTVTVTPVSEGTTMVTVTATDAEGSNTPATQTFTVTVAPSANGPPVAVGTLAPLRIGVDEGAVTVEVSGAFRDPDGDRLTYAATSSAPAVATAAVSGSTVTVTPVAPGTATVTATATDTGGSNTAATQTFGVTVPRPFTDHPIVPGVTPVKAVHFTELRARIDALRRGAGLAPFAWTDRVLTAGVTRVRLAHLLELRSALGPAYAASGRSAPGWTDASPAGGATPIRAAHLLELRAAVTALE